jgi:hypothetical protein
VFLSFVTRKESSQEESHDDLKKDPWKERGK